jgi:N12 class adenine-specific DNA methylase
LPVAKPNAGQAVSSPEDNSQQAPTSQPPVSESDQPQATITPTTPEPAQGAGSISTPTEVAQHYTALAPDMAGHVATGMGARLHGEINDDGRELPQSLYPNNPVSRKVFAKVTGVKLPSGITASKKAYADWKESKAKPTAAPTAPAPVKNSAKPEQVAPDMSKKTKKVSTSKVLTRGTAKPAAAVKFVLESSTVKPTDRAGRFVQDFVGRLHKMNPAAFEGMEVHSLSQADWDAHAELGQRTPDSAGAFDQHSNTLYLNRDKTQGEAIVNAFVHEMGHFAEKFALGEEFTNKEWRKLDEVQRQKAAEAYDPNNRKGRELIDDKKARSEWVAMQFARVVRGDTEQMPKKLLEKLTDFLNQVRSMLNKWIGDGKLTTAELDKRILDALEYTLPGQVDAYNDTTPPHLMTQDGFMQNRAERKVGVQRVPVMDARDRDIHRNLVENALATGELTETMARALGHFNAYPDLAPKPAAKPDSAPVSRFDKIRQSIGKDASVASIIRDVVLSRDDVKNSLKNTHHNAIYTITSAVREETTDLQMDIVNGRIAGESALGKSWLGDVNAFTGLGYPKSVAESIFVYAKRGAAQKSGAAAPLEVIKGENGTEARIFVNTDGNFNVIPVDTDANESFGAVRTNIKTIEEARRIANEMMAGKPAPVVTTKPAGEGATATTITPPKPAKVAAKPSKISAELQALGDELLGTPAAPAPNPYGTRFNPAKVEVANKFVALLVREHPDVRSKPALAAFIVENFPGLKPFSDSLARSIGAFAEFDDSGTFADAYAKLDGNTNPTQSTTNPNEPTSQQPSNERAGGEEPTGAPRPQREERTLRVGEQRPEAGSVMAGGREPVAETQGSGEPSVQRGDAGGEGRGDTPRVDGDVGTLRRPESQPSQEVAAATPATGNYRITPADRIGEGGLTTKFRDNLAAIRTIKQIIAEKRPATVAEQSLLVRYVGWGGLKSRFDTKSKDYSSELANLLTPEEYAAARRSVQDAHYTSPTVITRGIYAAMARFGFRGGKMVEGGVGIGNFIGMMPDSMRSGTSYLGIERDPITAQIAQAIYPEARIHNAGFQESDLARDTFDGSVGNPPFGNQTLTDKAFKEEAKHSIHNYFIAKQLALLRPGGVASYVVSHYFLDAKDPSARQFIAKSAEFLGAIRLPNTAFKQNANTEVTTDIVFFRKLAPGEQATANQDWVNLSSVADPATGKPIPVNAWLATRPEMMLGTMTLGGSMYAGRDEATLEPRGKGQDLGADLDAAVARLPENVYQHVAPAVTDRLTLPEPMPAPAGGGVPAGVRVGAYYVAKDGKLMRRAQDYNMEQQAEAVAGVKEADLGRIKGMIAVRDALNALVKAEFNTQSNEAQLDALREGLNQAYDTFVKEFGHLNRPVNRRAFFNDPEAFRILGLESDYDAGVSAPVAKKQGGTKREPSAKKAAIFTKRVNQPYREITKVGTAKEALAVALNQRGDVDLAYMQELSGIPEADILRELDGLIFKTPTGGYESRDQYLSGNVRQKFKQAEAAQQREGDAWASNVEALRAVIPADIPAVDISAPVGAPWVPASDVSRFVSDITGLTPDAVVYRKSDGGWLFNMGSSNVATNETWGVSIDGRTVGFEKLFSDALNARPTIVYDKTSDDKLVVNEKLTALATIKAEEIKQKWADWIWDNEDRRERLARIYNDTANNYVDPKYDGSHLTLPGASPLVKLRQHQMNVVWRTITERRALYDHVVGAGKTFAGVAAFMEMRRMGRVRKPLFVVPNHLTKQWSDEFVKLYPNANVLYTSPSDFDKENRQTLFAKILTGEYDAVIIGHSQFKKIGVSPEIEKGILTEMIAEISETIEAMKAAEGKRRSRAVAQAEKTKEKIEEKLKKLSDGVGARDSVATFEELGIDGLFVDEAHEFKNLFYTTQMQRVAGLGDPAGSAKAFDLYLKTQYMHKRFGGKAPLVFATGTPISNSLVEMFTMQRYLQPDVLKDMGLKTLDAWVKVFGDVKQVYEVDPTGTGYRMATRLAQFQNVGEISSIYRTVSDVITMADLEAQSQARGERFPVPKLAGGKPNNYVSDRTADQEAYFGVEVQKMGEDGSPVYDAEGDPVVSYPPGTILYRVDNMPDDPKKDNMLKLTNDARKAGLDMRLINPSYPDRPESKINRSVAEIVAQYKKWSADRGTQLVFCDLSVPASARGDATKKVKEKLKDFYFIKTANGELAAIEDAKPVKFDAAPDIEFFVSKDPTSGTWGVSERSSGVKVKGGLSTKSEAIARATDVLSRTDLNVLRENITKLRPTEEQVAEALGAWLESQEQAAAEAPAAEGEAGTEGEAESGAVSMDELLADSSSFSVYDDMKAKLIAAGIPAAEIAFIHDYKTPLAKQKLFDQMNRGEMRILFGSTPKLGAGTNVQKRLVALHHLDAPWRPSDLEQREGRIIRQGNELYARDPEGFEVVVNRYATKQTYDTRMWQLLEHKARGIEGFRKADRTTRRIEDVSGEAANASDMKAAASGDPLIQQEIELRNQRSKLELQERAHKQSKYEMQGRAKWLREAPQRRDAVVADAQTKIDARQPVPEPWVMTDFFDKPLSDGKKGISGAVAKAIQSAKMSGERKSSIGYYRGYEFLVAVDEMAKNGPRVEIGAKPRNSNQRPQSVTDYIGDDTISDTGFVQRLDNYLAGFEAKIEEANIQAQRSAEGLKQIEAELAKPFTKGAELERVRAEHEKVRAELMQKKGKRKGASQQSPGDTGPLGTPAEGQSLREADATMVNDRADKPLLDTSKLNAEIVKSAAEEVRSWPETVVAADGSGIDMKVADKGSIATRVWHLIRDGNSNTIHKGKAAWIPRVVETLRNAQVRLVDVQDGTRIYVRKYDGGVNHAVIIRPDGKVEEQRAFDGSLITHFPLTTDGGRQAHLRVDWVRGDIQDKGEGLRQNAPSPTPPASTVSGPRREVFRKNPASDNTQSQLFGTPATEAEPTYSKFQDSLRARGVPVERDPYEVRKQADVAAEARQLIADKGEAEARKLALDRNSGVRGDTRIGVIGELMAREMEAFRQAAPTDKQAIMDRMDALAAASRDVNSTEAGQQISMHQHIYKDQRIAAPMEYIKNVRNRQEQILGEDGTGVMDETVADLNKATREAVERMIANKADVINRINLGIPLWERYRNQAAERLAKLVGGMSVSKQQAPVAEFTSRLVAELKARMKDALPDSGNGNAVNSSPSALEVLTEAMRNKEKYKEVFDAVRADLAGKYGEGSPIMEAIDTEMANMGAAPYSRKTLERAVKDAHEALGLKIAELAKQHVSKTNATSDDLAKSLVDEAGLTGSDAQRLADDLAATSRQFIADARTKALDQLKKKFENSTNKVKRIISAIAKVSTLNNLGALTRADLIPAVAKELKLPGVTAEQLKTVADLADKVENAPNELARVRAEYDLMNGMRIVKGLTAADVGLSVWYANLLSGFTTQMANAQSNMFLSTIQLGTLMATNPKNAGHALTGWVSGFNDGWLHGKEIMATGRSLREMGEVGKTGEAGNVLESVNYARDFVRLPSALAYGLQKHAAVMKYVSRAMRAADAVFFYPAREAYARVATAKILEGQYQGAELHSKIRESLGIAPDQFIKWEQQAKAEGWTGMDKALRVSQLIEGHREANMKSEEVGQRASQYGRESTLNQNPVGIAGAVYRNLRSVTNDLPAMQIFLPFLRVPTNLFNTSLNFTPVGAVRAKFGMLNEKGDGRQEFTQEERARLYFQAVAGSMAMVGIAAMAGLGGGDDDDNKERFFDITAKGSTDWRKNQQLEATGWRPFSFKVGNKWISYKDSPLLLPLAAVAQAVDAKRFQTSKDELAGKNPYLNAMFKLPQTIFETSMLSGLGTLMDIASGSSSPDKIEGFLANTATSAVIPNLVKQVDRLASPETRNSDGVGGRVGQVIPGLRQTGSVKTEVLGEAVKRSPLDRFGSDETNDPLREVLRNKNVFISTPAKSTKLPGGAVMTPEQYNDYVRISGERIKERLTPMVDRLKVMNPEQVERTVDTITQNERDRAKAQIARARNVFMR